MKSASFNVMKLRYKIDFLFSFSNYAVELKKQIIKKWWNFSVLQKSIKCRCKSIDLYYINRNAPET